MDWTLGENKPNSKPISNGITFIYNTEDCHGPLGLAMTPKGNLKKQSQFADGANRRKLLFERILWQYTGLQGTKKQSQFKAKQSQIAKYHDGVHFVGKKDPREVRVLEQADNHPENVNRELKTEN